MRTLAASARRKHKDTGEFLPDIFHAFKNAKIKARMGTATFVAGPPGAMKTGLVLYYLLRLNRPTLYFSADAEDFEIVERAAATVSGDSMDQVRADPSKYAGELEKVSNIRFVYEDAPTYDDLVLEVAAYAETFGRFPEIIAIDNLMNVTSEQENEWSGMRDTAKVIHKLTRVTKAAVFVLHHMSDDRTDPTTPAPRKSMQGKVAQLPKAIWSLALDGDRLRVAAVKNRWGPADPSGQQYVEVFVDPARNRFFNSRVAMQIGDIA